MAQTTVLGLAKLQRKLDRLPKAAREAIRQAMAEQADEIVAMMKRLAPVLDGSAPGRRPGALRDSIGWTWGKAPKGSFAVSAVKGVGLGGGTTITIYAGNEEAFYARWVEFGTAKMAASPYFYVSWRASRKASRRKISAAVRRSAKAVAAGG